MSKITDKKEKDLIYKVMSFVGQDLLSLTGWKFKAFLLLLKLAYRLFGVGEFIKKAKISNKFKSNENKEKIENLSKDIKNAKSAEDFTDRIIKRSNKLRLG